MTQDNGRYVVQCHSGSLVSVPVDSSSATSYTRVLANNTNLQLISHRFHHIAEYRSSFRCRQGVPECLSLAHSFEVHDCDIWPQETRHSSCMMQSIFRHLEPVRRESRAWQTGERLATAAFNDVTRPTNNKQNLIWVELLSELMFTCCRLFSCSSHFLLVYCQCLLTLSACWQSVNMLIVPLQRHQSYALCGSFSNASLHYFSYVPFSGVCPCVCLPVRGKTERLLRP